MRYNPIITSYANIACLFTEIPINNVTVKWFFGNFFNLAWDKETNELIPCGTNISNRYEAIMNCPFIDVEIHSKEYLINKKEYRDDIVVLCPINTKLFGITEKEYIHDVMLKELEPSGQCKVYDFWQPQFKWKFQVCDYNSLVESIDFTNKALFNKIIVFVIKNLSNFVENVNYRCGEEVLSYLHTNYIEGKYVYGIEIYDSFCRYINSFNSYYDIPVTNFQILYEHYLFVREAFKTMQLSIGNTYQKCNYDLLFSELVKKIEILRNYVMKIWYSKKNAGEWKHKICKELLDLKREESNLLNKISETKF